MNAVIGEKEEFEAIIFHSSLVIEMDHVVVDLEEKKQKEEIDQ